MGWPAGLVRSSPPIRAGTANCQSGRTEGMICPRCSACTLVGCASNRRLSPGPRSVQVPWALVDESGIRRPVASPRALRSIVAPSSRSPACHDQPPTMYSVMRTRSIWWGGRSVRSRRTGPPCRGPITWSRSAPTLVRRWADSCGPVGPSGRTRKTVLAVHCAWPGLAGPSRAARKAPAATRDAYDEMRDRNTRTSAGCQRMPGRTDGL